jgi:hypothetical protein
MPSGNSHTRDHRHGPKTSSWQRAFAFSDRGAVPARQSIFVQSDAFSSVRSAGLLILRSFVDHQDQSLFVRDEKENLCLRFDLGM